MKRLAVTFALCVATIANIASADLINELEPLNSSFGTQSVEIKGTAGDSFFVDLVAIGTTGVVDRAVQDVSGTYDSNGLAVISINDLADPSYTLLLTRGFNFNIGDDLDSDNDGVLNAGTKWQTLYDAIGINGGSGLLYGQSLGFVDLPYNGESPDLLFRDGTSDALYFTIDSDTDSVFDEDGNDVLLTGTFDMDPFATTFNAVNPSLSAVPEPGSMGILAAAGLVAGFLRRRR